MPDPLTETERPHVSPATDAGDRTGGRPWRFGCLVEHTVGHVTFGHVLARAFAAAPDVEAEWHPLRYAPQGPIEALPPLDRNWSARASARARAILARRHGRYDAVLFHTQTASLLSVGPMRAVPTVISLDATPRNIDEVGEGYAHGVAPARVEALKLVAVRRALRAASTLIAWSDWVRRSLVDDYGIDPSRIEVIPAGTSNPAPSDASGARRPGPIRVLFVGGDFARKGGPLLLDALAEIPDAVELHVVTTSPVDPRPGVVVHRGVEPGSAELAQLYADADLFVLPTLADASPHVVLEAMAAGLPVVSTRLGAIPEAVVDGETGLLVAPGDRDGLVQALRRLLDSPREREAMAEGARERARREFDAARNGARVVDVLRRAAAAGPRTGP